MHLFDKPCERLPTKTVDSLNERAHFFTRSRRVLGQVGQITFAKDLDLQVEMAVMEQLGNMSEDGKEYFWDLIEECPTGLNEIFTTCSH